MVIASSKMAFDLFKLADVNVSFWKNFLKCFLSKIKNKEKNLAKRK